MITRKQAIRGLAGMIGSLFAPAFGQRSSSYDDFVVQLNGITAIRLDLGKAARDPDPLPSCDDPSSGLLNIGPCRMEDGTVLRGPMSFEPGGARISMDLSAFESFIFSNGPESVSVTISRKEMWDALRSQ